MKKGDVYIMNIKEFKKMNGTIVYRSNIYLGIDRQTGKKVRTTITASTKKAVKIKAREAQIEFERNGYTVNQKTKCATYSELVNLWWDSYKNTVKRNTRESVRGIIKHHLLPVFGSMRLDKLTTSYIQKEVNKWADKANNGEAKAYNNYSFLSSLNRRILQYGVTMQLIESNPARDVTTPRRLIEKEQKIKFFSNDELKAFLAYLENLDLSIPANVLDYTLYKLLLATGCRISEVLALEWSDIDLDTGVVNINKTLNRYQETNSPKSKAGYRDIEIDSETIATLKRYKKHQQVQAWQIGGRTNVIFTPFTTKYFHHSILSRRLKKHLKACGVPNIGFHGFRHTHATIMLYAGIEPKDLQHRLGHSNISMTLNTYVHATKEGAKKAVSIFEKAISNL